MSFWKIVGIDAPYVKPESSESNFLVNMSPLAPSLEDLKTCLLDVNEPMGKRTRSVFYLRTRADKDALEILSQALRNREDSALMRHEIAYVIGQIQDSEGCGVLSDILRDVDDDCMVRHEAAEALGAIGNLESVGILEEFLKDEAPEISETCEIAIQLIRWKNSDAPNKEEEQDRNPYLSVDPAPAAGKSVSNEELEEILINPKLPLFERYRAMFSLRNRNTEESSLTLARGFQDKSVLFRHEVAYVMGQMENPACFESLKKVLEDENEHRMVRHEAAEALGAIGTSACEEILKKYLQDEQRVVKESCEVALDIIDYWNQPTGA